MQLVWEGSGELCPLSHWERQPSYKPGDIILRTPDAGGVGDMRRQTSTSPWPVRVLEKVGDLGGCGCEGVVDEEGEGARQGLCS